MSQLPRWPKVAFVVLWVAFNIWAALSVLNAARDGYRDSHRTNIIVECASKITVTVPANKPGLRQAKFVTCLSEHGISYVDALA